LAGQTFEAAQAMQPALDARREFLNTEYPSRTWQGRPPLTACPQAQHSLRSYTPETEIALLDLSRIYAYLARQHWFRQVSQQGQFSLEGYLYYLEATWARQTIELTFVIQTLKNLSAPPRMGNARTAYRHKDCASRI